ncbi:ATP-binding protein [Streptomyces halobius]|uniref:ATP-binding protein n=1 Tax=Streptomyces halobius TaxID=2879846 RepID=A0ABY4M904_9ACTN|nr:ATP-binding protein [Streptomyces halobius]UQA92756.1 ATP-binding protein [Streptomyces halobius]
MGDEEVMSASGGGNATDTADTADTARAGYAPHPHIGGRTAVLRALAAWRMRWPGAPRVIVLTGSPGSGRSRLITGFLMLCDPEYRKRLPLDHLDPATVPPELPAPAVPNPEGLTSAQLLWTLADHFELSATRAEDIFTELGAREEPVTIVVPDVDLAGPVRAVDEPARLVQDVLEPLATTGTVHLLADVPRDLATDLAGSLPRGQVQIIDLDEPEWADPEGLALHAETALLAATESPDRPYTTDPDARRALAEAIARRADGNRLTVQLAVQSLLMQPEGFDPSDASQLPSDVGEALDLHARRLGADPRTLRLMLAPLAFAEGRGLPVHLLGTLAGAIAGRDMSQDIADGMMLAAPFVQPVEVADDEPDGVADDELDADGDGDGSGATESGESGESTGTGGRTLLRLLHRGIADAIRAGLPDVRDAQTKIAMALLEAVPEQDWSKADPYIRDHLAAHTLEAGLLPQLLTDPGLFAHADPVSLRAAVEAVPLEQLGAAARTYLRVAPLLTRTQAPAGMRAALLETAFVEDGLAPWAEALHRLGFALPWRTLWSLPVTGASAVTVGSVAEQDGAEAGQGTVSGTPADGAAADGQATVSGTPSTTAPRPVAAILVPEGTPGSRPLPRATDEVTEGTADTTGTAGTAGPEGGATGAAGAAAEGSGSAFLLHDLLRPGYLDADPAQVLRPSEDERAAAPFAISRGADYLRVWARASQEVVAALVSDTPFTGADLSPDGVLVIATERGVTARQITAAVPLAATPTVPAQAAGAHDADASHGLEGDHS